MHRVLKNRQRDLTLICENIHDPHNVSAIFRSCDAVGIDTLHLLYTIESFPKIGKKSSGSAKKWVEIVRHKDPKALQDHLKSKGFTIYATYLTADAKSIYKTDLNGPSAILVGNEHRGVSEEALRIADEIIYIPMLGMVESLNVSVAAAIILYEACRQRLETGRYPANSDEDEWVLNKLNIWQKRN